MKQQTIKTGICWLATGVFMSIFDPATLPVVFLIVPFILVFLTSYTTWLLGCRLFVRYGRRKAIITVRGKRMGMAVSVCLTLMLVLQSLGQLTYRDAYTIAAIAIIGYIYFLRNKLAVDDKR